MSAVINISHPMLSGKPPINHKYPSIHGEEGGGGNGETNDSTKEMVTGIFEERKGNLDDPYRIETNDFIGIADDVSTETDKCVNDVKTRMLDLEVNDCNQNLIGSSDGCSFEQLCKMINELEGNIAENVPDRGDVSLLDKGYNNRLEPERDRCKDKCGSIGATYEDIMLFLATLEDGYPNDVRANKTEANTSAILQELLAKEERSSWLNRDKYVDSSFENRFSNPLKDDLATAELELEEKNATIEILKNQLKKEREAACEKLKEERKNNATKLEAQEKRYRAIVKRHQKFVEKLIAEKTDLTEKCDSLAQRTKEIETKAAREMKVLTERHVVEMQRAKERLAASEKIKRERWLEAKTSKIKEMTVKGLEPELRSMVEQHRLEIEEIRSIHIKELQDTELRVIRHSNQQLEQLRLELTASHEKVLANEKNILWTRYKEKLEEQEAHSRTERLKFAEELERERKRFDEELAKRESEKDTIIRQTYTRLQKELEDAKLKHQAEERALRESLQAEWTEWLENYKRQQVIKLEKAQNKIREESQRERDRQIELAIGRLEKETQDMKTVVRQSYESKLRSLKEKYETELRIVTDNEKIQERTLLSMEEKLANTENRLQITEKKLEECVTNFSNKNVLIEKLTAERDDARRIVQREVEAEKRVLEDKIASLYQELTQNNANKEMLMSQLYSRVKLIITQKVLTIKNLSKELEGVRAKCEHLEKLLDQQRKEYILKSL